MRRLGDIAWMVAAAAFIAATVGIAAYVGRPRPPSVSKIEEGQRLRDLDMGRIRDDVRVLSGVESRLSGSPGADRASEYILAELRRMGAGEIEVQEFNVAAPRSAEPASLSTVTSDGLKSVPAYPLWPNLARTCQTPPGGIVGPIVDAGLGAEADLSGKALEGSICIMDWNSNLEWLNIPEFGGKAIVFRANASAPNSMARNKHVVIPANIPRYYVRDQDLSALDTLLSAGRTQATLKCRASWEKVRARNILVRVTGGDTPEGVDPDHQPIVFHAYYDSISVVPDLAPGAEQACGAATLLELGRYLAGQKTRRPVYLLFTGGHGQSLSGMINFISRLRQTLEAGPNASGNKDLLARMGRPGLFVGLDITSRSDHFGVFCLGRFRAQPEPVLRPKFGTLGNQLKSFADSLVPQTTDTVAQDQFVDCINLTLGRGWATYFPYEIPFESELPTLAGFPGVTLSTVNDDRRRVDTPDDRFEHVNFELLGRQITSVGGTRPGLANMANALVRWTGSFVSSKLDDQWGKLTGRVVWLDQEKDYLPNQPLANAPVFMKMLRSDKNLMGTRGTPVAMTDAEGEYVFDGLRRNTNWYEVFTYMLEAYGTASENFLTSNPAAIREYGKSLKLPAGSGPGIETDGSILYAVDMARPADARWITDIVKAEQSLNLVTFPCRAFTVLGLTDPRGYITLKDLQVLDAATLSPPFSFGQSATDARAGVEGENLVTLWANPSLRVMLNVGVGFQDKRLVLINNTVEAPAGKGFVLKELETVPSLILQGAGDMWNLDESRIRKLEANGVNNPRVRQTHEEAGRYLKEARQALQTSNYLGYRLASERLWALESKAYGEILGDINNMIRGVLFYLALLLPFAYCLERLLVASTRIEKRVGWIIGIFVASFTILALVHPAFRFTFTPLLVLLAFVMIALLVTVGVLVLGKVDSFLMERKMASIGMHEDQRNVGNVVVRAIDLGIANIRRRPQRGFLTGLTVVLVTFTLLSFTSLVPVVTISRLRHPEGEPVYRGLLIRDRQWNAMPNQLHFAMRRSFGQDLLQELSAPTPQDSIVVPRGWFFSDYFGNVSQVDLAAVDPPTTKPSSGGKYTASALVCMSFNEPLVTRVGETLVAGRWFAPGEEDVAILPAHMAEVLGYTRADIGKRIRLYGHTMKVVGIIDSAKMDKVVDLDGEPLSPVNFVQQSLERANTGVTSDEIDTLEEYVHFSSEQIVYVPFRFGERIGAAIRSVAIKTGKDVSPETEAEGYAKRSNLTCLSSTGSGPVILYAALDTSQLSAAGQIVIPLFLGFLMVLGTMLGSVYERRREIFIYNSVGLSPRNVSSLFLAESSVYAVIGAGIGYLAGQAVSKILLVTGMLSGLSLNYTAGTAIFVTVLTMGIVIASTIYPARQAFHAAIPEVPLDVEKSAGDEEQVDRISFFLPFVAIPENVFAMQAYIHEYLNSLQGVTIGQLAVDNLTARVDEEGGCQMPVLAFRAWLAPFDLGVSHDVELTIAYRSRQNVYQYHLTATRFSGDQQNWRRLTPRFVLAIRKQLLVWRILSRRDVEKYQDRGRDLFSAASAVPGPGETS